MSDSPSVASSTTSRQPRFPADPLPPIILGGTVNLFSGAFGTGKTALLAVISAHLRDGLETFGFTPPAPVYQAIISADRSWSRSTKLWFDLAGFPDILHYSLQDDLDFNIERLRHKPQRIKILKEALDRINPPAGTLIYIDPIAPFMGGNLLDYDACLVHCSLIRRICLERQITVLGLAHTAKPKADPRERYLRPQDRILGSVAQGGYTDAQMYLASPEECDAPYYSFLMHSHHHPPVTFALARDAWGRFIPWDANAPTTDVETGLQHAILALCLVDTDIDTKTLLDTLRTPRTTLNRALAELLRSGRIERVRQGVYRRRKPS